MSPDCAGKLIKSVRGHPPRHYTAKRPHNICQFWQTKCYRINVICHNRSVDAIKESIEIAILVNPLGSLFKRTCHKVSESVIDSKVSEDTY